MKKLLKKFLTSIIVLCLVTLSGLLTILFFPQPLFAHTISHGAFKVYANEEINEHLLLVLDSAMGRVSKSELHDPAYRYNLLMSYQSFFNAVDDRILGEGPSARPILNNINIKVRIDLKNGFFYPTFHSRCQGDLTYLIAHEMIHCLQANKYGITKFSPFNHPPMWKLEGYPEYISRWQTQSTSGSALKADVMKYLELEKASKSIWIEIDNGGCQAPKYYYKGRLMVTYLMEIRGMTYHQILGDTTNEEIIFNEIVLWARQH